MRKLLIASAIALVGSTSANAVITISVATSLAPNSFGSPSYADYVSNATGALHDGQTSRGNPSSPSYYQQTTNVGAAQSIVTGFPSWMGKADPAAAFGAAYANELGNRMLFGIKIDGGGNQFSIDKLSFTAASSDPGNSLGFTFAEGYYNYSTSYVGLLKGADGILFTADDVYVTSGLASQLVDGLVGRGSGASLAAYCDACTTAQQQAAIDAAAATFTTNTTYTGTYNLNTRFATTGGSGAFNIAAATVPEPASWAMMVGGFGLLGGALRRRRAALAAA